MTRTVSSGTNPYSTQLSEWVVICSCVLCVDSFVNSQEWTLSRAVPDLKLVGISSLSAARMHESHSQIARCHIYSSLPSKNVCLASNPCLPLVTLMTIADVYSQNRWTGWYTEYNCCWASVVSTIKPLYFAALKSYNFVCKFISVPFIYGLYAVTECLTNSLMDFKVTCDIEYTQLDILTTTGWVPPLCLLSVWHPSSCCQHVWVRAVCSWWLSLFAGNSGYN